MRNTIKQLLTNDPFENWPNTMLALGGITGGEQPSRYSHSPDLWNKFFTALGLKGRFAAFDLPRPEQFEKLALEAIGLPGFIDLTVTNPFKATAYETLGALPYTCTVSDRARNLRSLNHIVRSPRSQEIFADNTDGMGMVWALKKHLPSGLDGSRVFLAGAGGAALAIGYELILEGAEIVVTNIVSEEAHKMAGVLSAYRKAGTKISISPWPEREKIAPSCSIIINAISCSAALSEAAIAALPPECLLADVRYGSGADFSKRAAAAGRLCVDGKQMLYGQFHFAAEKCGTMLGFPAETIQKHLAVIENWFCGSPESPER
jgi:shikimate 5-dehydrogenase